MTHSNPKPTKPWIDFAGIKDYIKSNIGILEVAAAFGVHSKRIGKEYFSVCPFHQENTPSFAMNSHKNFYKCFGCQAEGDQITLAQHLTGLDDYKEVLKWFQAEFNIVDLSHTPKKVTHKQKFLPGQQVYDKIKKLMSDDFAEQLDRVYSNLLDALPEAVFVIENMQKRGLETEQIGILDYKDLPVSRQHRVDLCHTIEADLEQIPGFFSLKGGSYAGETVFGGDKYGLRVKIVKIENNTYFVPIRGFLIPHRDSFGRIIALKIRNEDFQLAGVKEKLLAQNAPKRKLNNSLCEEFAKNWVPKYLYLSSQDQRAVTYIHHGNYFRMKDYYRRLKHENYWFVTEGEIKSDVISIMTGKPALGLPGVGSNHFELFWELDAFGENKNLDLLKNCLIKWEEWEEERLNWLSFKKTNYFNKVKALLTKSDEGKNLDDDRLNKLTEKKLIFAKSDDQDFAIVSSNFAPQQNESSKTKQILIAFDEDNNLSVAQALHRIIWMSLKLGITPINVRWKSDDGKGFDDLLTKKGQYWTTQSLTRFI